jgi:group I intron endonuclease
VAKYGIDAFDFKILALFDLVSAADYHEQAAILGFNTLAPNGYNLRAGAPYTRYGGSLSLETKQKMIGNHNGQKTQFVLGYHPTINTKQRMSAARKRTMVSEEIRTRISDSLMYHTVSPETKAKMSASHKKKIGT